jgi:hypothetical protein
MIFDLLKKKINPSQISLFKKLLFVLTYSNIIFAGYFLFLSYYNYFTLDDYCYIAQYKTHGLLGSVSAWYYDWQGRFAQQFVINVILFFSQKINSLAPFFISFAILWIFLIYSYLKWCVKIFLSNNIIKNYLILQVSAFVFFLILWLSIDRSTFFFASMSISYYGGSFALFALIYFIINDKIKHYQYILLVISSIYIGGGVESYALLGLLMLVLLVLFLFVFSKSKINRSLIIKTVVSFLLIAICFGIMYKAPGNNVRRVQYSDITIWQSLPLALNSTYHFFKIELASKVSYLLLIVSVFSFLGSFFRDKKSPDEEGFYLYSIILFFSLLLFSFAYFIPTNYATSSMGAGRTRTLLIVVFVFAVSVWGFLLGYKNVVSQKILFLFSSMLLIAFSYIIIKTTYKEFPILYKYSKAEKERIQKMKALSSAKSNRIVSFDKLPPHIWWCSGELDTIPNGFPNKCMEEALDLNIEIISK